MIESNVCIKCEMEKICSTKLFIMRKVLYIVIAFVIALVGLFVLMFVSSN